MCWQRTTILIASRDAPRLARGFVTSALDEAFGERSAISADAELAISELVTNSVNATASTLTVRLDLHRSHLRLAVEDNADGVPELMRVSETDEHGRGLAIVDVLASGWEVSARLPARKCGPTCR